MDLSFKAFVDELIEFGLSMEDINKYITYDDYEKWLNNKKRSINMNCNTRIFGTTFESYKPEGDMYNLIYKLVCDYGFYVPLHIICTENPNFLTDLIENKQEKHRRKIIMYRYTDESTGEITYALSIFKKSGPDIYMFNIDKYDIRVNKALENYLKRVYEKGIIDRSKLKWEKEKEEWIEMDKLRED